MAINLYSQTQHSGLFDVIGKAFKSQSDVNTSRGTTIPGDLQVLLQYFAQLPFTASLEQSAQPLLTAPAGYQSGAVGTLSTLQTFSSNVVIGLAAADRVQPDSSLKTALQYVITQMLASGQTVNLSTVTVTATATGSNTGDGKLIVSKRRGDGLIQENAIGETISGLANSTSVTSSITLTGQLAASSYLAQDWPQGSGTSATISSVDANTGAGSLLTNGGMETQANNTNVPDSWILSVGTPGTTCGMTVTQIQTLTVAGTPTSGTYAVEWQNPLGHTAATAPIAYNASSSTVQSALRLLSGLEKVTVAQSGTTPNFTHTVTMTGVPGDANQFAVLNYLNTGSVTPAITTHGTTQVFAGNSAFYFLSNGVELTTIQQQLTNLQPSTQYAVSLWACADSAPAAGVIKVDLVDGIGGIVINDVQGTANSISFNASSLTTSFQHLSALATADLSLRTPAVLPGLVYLRIRITTPVTSGRSVYIDNVAVAAMTQIYPGGPYAAAFTGSKAWAAGDAFSIAVTNDRAGVLREWSNRNFRMDSLGLLFPTSASPTIPDTVINPGSVTFGLDFSNTTNSQYIPFIAL